MNVKLARIRKRLTQEELCKLVKISKSTLVKIEKDEYDIRLSLMKKISKALNTSVIELFFRD